MTKQGWLPIYRKLKDHWLWQDKPFAKGQAWIDLLFLASHTDEEFLFGNQVIKNEIGSFITSELKLAERWGWSKTKTRAFLSLLESENMIIKKSDSKKTTVSIVNYSIYADFETAKKLQKNRKKTAEKQQKDTINNDNNDNNVNNDTKVSYSDDPKLNDALIAFVEYRKKIKKPMTEHAVNLMIDKLNKMTSSITEQVEILNQSIVNGWQGIFPLKEKQQPKAQKPTKQKSEFNSFMEQLANLRE